MTTGGSDVKGLCLNTGGVHDGPSQVVARQLGEGEAIGLLSYRVKSGGAIDWFRGASHIGQP